MLIPNPPRAYRNAREAFRLFNGWRKGRKLRKARKRGQIVDINSIDRKVEREMDAILNSVKSKTIWFGILTGIWGLAQVFIADGNFSTESIVSLITGVIIIVLRAVTTKPLADK